MLPAEKPISNFVGDVDHEDDWGLGWQWHQNDPGSTCSFPPPTARVEFVPDNVEDPISYFTGLFDMALIKDLVLETNMYAGQKEIGKFSHRIIYLHCQECCRIFHFGV